MNGTIAVPPPMPNNAESRPTDTPNATVTSAMGSVISTADVPSCSASDVHSNNPDTTSMSTPKATLRLSSAVFAMIRAPRGAPNKDPAASRAARPISTSPSAPNVAAPTAAMNTTAASDVAWASC
jgi:hypothetical protein